MAMVRMRATGKIPGHVAKRLGYRTRMLTADIQGGNEFVLSASEARVYRTAGWAEDVVAGTAPEGDPVPKRRGRPPKVAASRPVEEPDPGTPVPAPEEPEPSPQPPEPDESYRDKTVSELREMAVDRGVELPAGYIKHEELVRLIKGASR